MENTFAGVFTSGDTRQRSRVEIQLSATGLAISGPEGDRFWPHSAIRRSNVQLPDELVLKSGNSFQPDILNIQPAAAFIASLKLIAPSAPYAPGKWSMLAKALLLAAFLILLLVITLVAGGSWLLPKLAGYAARKVPYSVEQKLSKPMLAALLKTEKIDTAGTVALNGFYRQLTIRNLHPVHLTLVDKSVMNAFAVPGGEIVVYSGLLRQLPEPGMLVALLGHETGHVAGRHSLISLIREMAVQGLILLVLNDVNGLAAILLSRADMLQQLAYTRHLELAADRYSLQILSRHKFPPESLIRLLEVLRSAEAGSTAPPEFLSTHPAPETRLNEIRKLIKNLPARTEYSAPSDSLVHFWKKLAPQV